MSSASIPNLLRQLTSDRAKGQCEYCLIHQNFSIYSHEVDHIIAVKHGGQTIAENLALSCLPCNRYKGSDLAMIHLPEKLSRYLTHAPRYGQSIFDWIMVKLLGLLQQVVQRYFC